MSSFAGSLAWQEEGSESRWEAGWKMGTWNTEGRDVSFLPALDCGPTFPHPEACPLARPQGQDLQGTHFKGSQEA